MYATVTRHRPSPIELRKSLSWVDSSALYAGSAIHKSVHRTSHMRDERQSQRPFAFEFSERTLNTQSRTITNLMCLLHGGKCGGHILNPRFAEIGQWHVMKFRCYPLQAINQVG
jgi:hypothetical protein